MKIIKIVLLTFCLLSLYGCETAQQTQERTDIDDKKIRAAKINTQLGVAYLERGERQRAKQKLLLALEQGPNLPETWYTMGYFLENTGSVKEAGNYYRKAIQIAPKQGETHNNYGTFLCRTGDYPNAIEQFLEAVKDPNYLDMSGAYENAGLCSLKIPDKKQAIYYFAKAIKVDPNRPNSLLELADLYYKEKNYPLAKDYLDLYLRKFPVTAQTNQLHEKILVQL
jgi:type IV pilus assembly protein PilF